MTRTYAVLEVTVLAYSEIAGKLKEAGYDHVFMEDGSIDMHGLAIRSEPASVRHVAPKSP